MLPKLNIGGKAVPFYSFYARLKTPKTKWKKFTEKRPIIRYKIVVLSLPMNHLKEKNLVIQGPQSLLNNQNTEWFCHL